MLKGFTIITVSRAHARDGYIGKTLQYPSDPGSYGQKIPRNLALALGTAFDKKDSRVRFGFSGSIRDAVGQNICVFRESRVLILAHFFAVLLLPYKRQILYPSADPWHIGSSAQGMARSMVR